MVLCADVQVLLLQQWYSIAGDSTEYLINDRLSFQRFLGLSLGDKVPDAKTIWLFRENLTKSDSYRELFNLFSQQMQDQWVITRSGSIGLRSIFVPLIIINLEVVTF